MFLVDVTGAYWSTPRRLELTVRPVDSPIGLNGSGLVIANPPWKFDSEMTEALEELRSALGEKGRSQVEWLVEE